MGAVWQLWELITATRLLLEHCDNYCGITMVYVLCIVLGVFNIYLWLKVRALQRTVNSLSGISKTVINFIESELTGHEVRTLISQNKVSIGEIIKKLDHVENLALQALDYMGSFIRHNKQHPPTTKAIEEFIRENGISQNESSSKSS